MLGRAALPRGGAARGAAPDPRPVLPLRPAALLRCCLAGRERVPPRRGPHRRPVLPPQGAQIGGVPRDGGEGEREKDEVKRAPICELAGESDRVERAAVSPGAGGCE